MKKFVCFFAAIFLLLATAGCGSTGQTAPSEPEPAPVPEPIELSVSDLENILLGLDISGAALTFYGEDESTYPAGDAIRAEKYVKELQGYTWESYQVPTEWDSNDDYRCAFTCAGLSLTAYQSDYDNVCSLHAVTEGGEGWFALPVISAEEDGAAEQYGWMLFETFEEWYQESRAASLYKGNGTPLTAEELDWFQDYTASEYTYYDEEWGGYVGEATAVSCFFTSKYSNPRDMDAGEFLSYCPSQGELSSEDEKEFQLVQEKLDWRIGEDNHLASIAELPVPCHRLPRTYINEILTRYAGITVAEMNTDWAENALYIPETDCFYTFTSDFGPGRFVPFYGEKSGDTVTLWEAPDVYDENIADALTLQKSDNVWLVLSHQAAGRNLWR